MHATLTYPTLPVGRFFTKEGVRGYRFGFNGKEKVDEVYGDANAYDFGARIYDPRLGRWLAVDPLAGSFPNSSTYVYANNNPISFIDVGGLFPWPITINSFISARSVGLGLFRGDGRVAFEQGTSRVSSSFTVDPSAGTLTDKSTRSDPTVFYGTSPTTVPSIPSQTKDPEPEMSADIRKREINTLWIDFSHDAKDPITPSLVTPDLDLNATLHIKEDLENGILYIMGSFYGDNFPSAEAYISDQSGNKLFLGAVMETGGVHSLYGENENLRFTTLMQVMFDSDGNFTGVKQGEHVISVEDWNKKVQESFNK